MASIPGGGPASPLSFVVALQGAGAAMLFASNWFGIYNLFSGYVPIGHLWSLAIEGQWYLLWAPFVVVLLRGRRLLVLGGALLVGVASLAETTLLLARHTPGLHVHTGTDRRCPEFAMGSVVAVLGARGRILGGRPVVGFEPGERPCRDRSVGLGGWVFRN